MTDEGPSTAKRRSVATGLSFAAIAVAVAAEIVLAGAVVPHGDRSAAVHAGWILSINLDRLSLTIANVDIVSGVFALISMVGVWLLSNQTIHRRAGLGWAAVIALISMYQLNIAGEIEDVVQKAQPTGSMAIDAFNDIKPPALAIIVVDIAFLVWLAWARKARVKLP